LVVGIQHLRIVAELVEEERGDACAVGRLEAAGVRWLVLVIGSDPDVNLA
jgi:hypothetical protein